MKKLVIITDTTSKQTNGVVRTLEKTIEILSREIMVEVVNPESFRTFSLPFYKEIDVSVDTWRIGRLLEKFKPDYIHIATEGPVGLAGKLYCDKKDYSYTSSYHSMFPEFILDMFKVPVSLTYPYFRWFHSRSKNILVPTNLVKRRLEDRGFNNLVVWRRGVDHQTFNPSHRTRTNDSNLKIILCVSRVSKEKGLDDFCQIPVPCGYLKVLVGDGPYLSELMRKYHTEAVAFVGKKTGKELAEKYANADIFIFPSKNDTFGLTQLEAMASGTPVIAYRNTVSEEIITPGVSGLLVDNITADALNAALSIPRSSVEQESLNWRWEACTETFKRSLVPI